MHHIVVAEEFELRRSSRAEVSQTVAAIDHHRTIFLERAECVVQQLRERQVHGFADRTRPMLMSREDVDDLPAFGDNLQNFTMIDDPHSSGFYARARGPANRKAAIRAIIAGPPLAERKLLFRDFLQDVDLRTSIEQGADSAAEGLHVIGLSMMIERGLILVGLVVDELGWILNSAMEDVLQRAGLGGAHGLDHFARRFFELLLASGLGFEFGNDGNRHRILLATDWFRRRQQ
jgi:hypothetical protein